MGLKDLEYADQQPRRAKQKHELVTRRQAKEAKDREDERRLRIWRSEVRARAGGVCFFCNRKTVKTRELQPDRGEAAHIASRRDHAVRYDRRNGLHAHRKCHDLFDRHKLRLLPRPDQYFTVNDQAYINGDCLDLAFERVA